MSVDFREPSVTSSKDDESRSQLKDQLDQHSPSLFNKLDNFTRYTQTRTISRFIARERVFDQILEIPGSIIEVGVGRGFSLFQWAHLSSIFEPVNITRRVIGFDTFSGVASHHSNDFNGQVDTLNTSSGFMPETNTFEEINESIDCFHKSKPLPHIPLLEVVQGDATVTVPQYLEDHPELLISLLHIDVDIYMPTLTTLEACLPRMPKGAVILFDELCSHAYPGETIAVREYFDLHGLSLKRFPFSTTVAYAVV